MLMFLEKHRTSITVSVCWLEAASVPSNEAQANVCRAFPEHIERFVFLAWLKAVRNFMDLDDTSRHDGGFFLKKSPEMSLLLVSPLWFLEEAIVFSECRQTQNVNNTLSAAC